MKTAIIAALPRELAGLTLVWERRSATPRGVTLFEHTSAVAVCAGMGCERVSVAVAAAMACGGIGRLLSIGLAGACAEDLQAGAVLQFGTVIDVRSGERFGSRAEGPILATAAQIASVAEKRRLRESYGAAAVDMEAACVGRLARAHGLEFAAIKAISDAANFALEGLEKFATADGQFREMAFAWHTALHPGKWRNAVELGRNSAKAIHALTIAVQKDLETQEGTGR